MPKQQPRVLRSTKSSGKSFSATGSRLSGPPARLVQALRELGDEESATRLVKAYPTAPATQSNKG